MRWDRGLIDGLVSGTSTGSHNLHAAQPLVRPRGRFFKSRLGRSFNFTNPDFNTSDTLQYAERSRNVGAQSPGLGARVSSNIGRPNLVHVNLPIT